MILSPHPSAHSIFTNAHRLASTALTQYSFGLDTSHNNYHPSPSVSCTKLSQSACFELDGEKGIDIERRASGDHLRTQISSKRGVEEVDRVKALIISASLPLHFPSALSK